MAHEKYPHEFSYMISHCIAGHHTGLLDTTDLNGASGLCDRLSKQIPDYRNYLKDGLHLPANTLLPDNFVSILKLPRFPFGLGVLIRMLYSCLIDADWDDTRLHSDKYNTEKTSNANDPHKLDLHTIRDKLFEHIRSIETDARKGRCSNNHMKVLELRTQTLQSCKNAAKERQGIFTLTVPTGGGKTLASLAFALEHALTHDMERIIYVVPFTSITEQISDVFRDVVKDDSVLEHHSAFDSSKMSDVGLNKLKLAWEKWNYPIVVTTAVQFFESLFSNKPKKCRKLHNIVNSVVILDEAQSIPLEMLRPCMAMLNTLSKCFNVTIVLCTATQPALGKSDEFKDGFDDVCEIIPDPSKMALDMKRTRIVDLGDVDDDVLVGRLVGNKEFFDHNDDEIDNILKKHKQVLCIVNTRKRAKFLYERINTPNNAYHLSALMCPKHRSKKLKDIKNMLRADKSCIVISTSLIEAGVDIDFDVVYREINGLESIAQAAGRCNREGLRKISDVYIFKFKSQNIMPSMQRKITACQTIMNEFQNPLSPKAIQNYFQKIYWISNINEKDELDKEGIMGMGTDGSKNVEFAFASIANKFKIIQGVTQSIIIRYDDDAVKLINELNKAQKLGNMPRKLQPYVVTVHNDDFLRLKSAHVISNVAEEKFGDQFWVLDNSMYDHNALGLVLEDPTYRSVENNTV